MGLTHIQSTIRSLSKQGEPYEAQFLVDTGSIDCVAPREALVAAGITPEATAFYQLASGETIECEYGFARIQFLGHETVAQVVFGASESEPILGVVVLDNLGYVVDPVTKKLRGPNITPRRQPVTRGRLEEGDEGDKGR